MAKRASRIISISAAVVLGSFSLAGCETIWLDDRVDQLFGRGGIDEGSLNAIVAARSDEDKARDEWRHPVETLAFFGVDLDMVVVEALPGGGWYTKILAPYLLDAGGYAGVDYAIEMYPVILPNMSDERLEALRAWPTNFPAKVDEYAGGELNAYAFQFGDAPQALLGEADAFLFVRALHNLNRAGGAYLDTALSDAYALLKPGGVLGVVQHRAAEDASAEFADGSHGYLKQSQVIAMIEDAGFVLEAASEINANPADIPGADDVVWRLPPTLGYGETNRDAFIAIGESDRMTLRFRKPAQ